MKHNIAIWRGLHAICGKSCDAAVVGAAANPSTQNPANLHLRGAMIHSSTTARPAASNQEELQETSETPNENFERVDTTHAKSTKIENKKHLIIFLHGLNRSSAHYQNFIHLFSTYHGPKESKPKEKERKQKSRWKFVTRSQNSTSSDTYREDQNGRSCGGMLDFNDMETIQWKDEVDFFAPDCNKGNTFDGVDNGGERAFHALLDYLSETVVADQSTIDRIDSLRSVSLIGHSLGGLYARMILRLAYSPTPAELQAFTPEQTVILDKFRDLEQLVFTTFASPHCGVRLWKRLNPFPCCRCFPVFVTRMIGRSINQVCLMDTELLLWEMTREAYLKPLRGFKRRALYANLINDPVVDYFTSSLHRKETNPYKRTSVIGRRQWKAGEKREMMGFCVFGKHCRSCSVKHSPDESAFFGLETCPKYGNITTQSLQNPTPHVTDSDEKAGGELRACGMIAHENSTRSPRCEIHRNLSECCKARLSNLRWEVYDVLFSGKRSFLVAHGQIVWKYSKKQGENVVLHCLHELFIPTLYGGN